MTRLRQLAKLLAALLRELADENAYQRHLDHWGRPHTPEEWRRFHELRLHAKFTRAKCC